jgi:hypothetical protein
MKPHVESLYNTFFRMPAHRFFPPGYTSFESMRRIAIDKVPIFGPQTIENLMKHGVVLCGSPNTVRQQLGANAVEWGFDTHVGVFHFGTLPRDLTERSLRLFASEVAPHLRHLNEPAPSAADQTVPAHVAV